MNKKANRNIYWVSCLLCLVLTAGCDPDAMRTGDEQDPEILSQSGNLFSRNKVEILKTGNRFQLLRNGKPYFIKGVCGRDELEAAAAAGANSVRTYTSSGLDTLLDKAHRLGLSVMVGLWLGREIEGFDYDDRQAVEEQKEEVKEVVSRYKDHPALLFWALGNEPDNSATNKKSLWKAMNDLAGTIRQIDPNHPVTTVTWSKGYRDVLRYCPNIDFLSINAFGNIHDFNTNLPRDKPFLYSEWGPQGPWERPKTYWHAALEQSIVEKYELVKETYTSYISADSLNCLGSYIFYWGQKQEYTPTWFSFFTENGAPTPLVDAMSQLWTGSFPENRAPFLDSLLIDGRSGGSDLEIPIAGLHTASVRSWDPDGDALKLVWEIIPDGPFFKYVAGSGKVEVRPEPMQGLILDQVENRIVFKSPPHTGPYRLLVYAYDEKGKGAYANVPFFLANNSLTDYETH